MPKAGKQPWSPDGKRLVVVASNALRCYELIEGKLELRNIIAGPDTYNWDDFYTGVTSTGPRMADAWSFLKMMGYRFGSWKGRRPYSNPAFRPASAAENESRGVRMDAA